MWKRGDSNTAIHVVNNFTEWSINNCMKCNFSECKELVFRKKGYNNVLDSQYRTSRNIQNYVFWGLHFRKIVGSLFTLRTSWRQLIKFHVYIFLEPLGRKGIVRRSWINYSALLFCLSLCTEYLFMVHLHQNLLLYSVSWIVVINVDTRRLPSPSLTAYKSPIKLSSIN